MAGGNGETALAGDVEAPMSAKLKSAIATLPLDAVQEKQEVATLAVQTLGNDAVEAKKEVANAALQSLGADAVEAKKDIAVTAARSLPVEAQEDLLVQLQGPSRQVSDRIWQWIVGAFAIVFIGGTGALVAAVFLLETAQVQVLLTVFTTVAGILAGFISGRASSSTGSSTS